VSYSVLDLPKDQTHVVLTNECKYETVHCIQKLVDTEFKQIVSPQKCGLRHESIEEVKAMPKPVPVKQDKKKNK